MWSCLNEKTKQSIENLKRAFSRLGDAIKTPAEQNSLLIDGTIQRFEFCIELFWKMLRRALLESGVESGTPREASQKAYQAKWLNDEQLWIQMLQDRNRASRVYEEEIAQEIFSRVPQYYEIMSQALADVEGKLWPDTSIIVLAHRDYSCC